MYYIHISFS